MTSELGEDFKYMRELRQAQHEKWHRENRAEIDASGIPYTDRGEALLFRFADIKVDFYPSTGRWRLVGIAGGKAMRGGARAFLAWLGKRAGDLADKQLARGR